MFEIRQTDEFEGWFNGLRDHRARARINIRIRRLSLENPGDSRPVGQGVSEMRSDYGPGYRVYYVMRGATVAVLLAGRHKGSQRRDIQQALRMARGLE